MTRRTGWRRAHTVVSLTAVVGVALALFTTSAPSTADSSRVTAQAGESAAASGDAGTGSPPTDGGAASSATPTPTPADVPASAAESGPWMTGGPPSAGGSAGSAAAPADEDDTAAPGAGGDEEGTSEDGGSAVPGYTTASVSGAGVPAGWSPTTTMTSDLRITTAGAVVQDIRLVNADLVIDAPNVTVRRVEVQGGSIDNGRSSGCRNGMLLEDVSVIRAPGQVTAGDEPAIGTGGYTARRVLIDGLPEGFRVGGRSSGCGPVTIENSFARVRYPDRCTDWHGDTLQGYDGPALTIVNTTLVLVESNSCGGTAPFFYPAGQGNTSVDLSGLTVSGGGYSFRLGMPGRVVGLSIVDQDWGYGPMEVSCGLLSGWDARLIRADGNAQATATVRSIPCQG